jgi:long-chain acyl-CoA synthetase
MGQTATPFRVAEAFAGRRLLFVGATGFVGKVALSLLLRRYPELGKVFVLVRPGAGSSSEERFFHKIAASPVFDPLREAWGDGFDAFLREKCQPIPGDVARPNLNFSEADLERLGRLDAIINCAGLVTFDPGLDSALRINVYGPRNCLEVARRTGAVLVHVSTCFVAGKRDGEIWEDEEVVGYFPRRDRGDGTQDDALGDDDFSVEAEVADCERIIEQVKARADDRAHVSLFRDRAIARLRDEGRDSDDERTLKIAVQRERKMWVAERLKELGLDRARHWGWTNTYTYTKSLGDQVCASAKDVRTCIVRPAIVESSVAYPFAGWNEGFTTTAPLVFIALKGHRHYPAGDGVILDLVPVDMVAAGLIMATAATLRGENKQVYQLGSSDENPFYVRRAVDLLGLHVRRHYQRRAERGEGVKLVNRVRARLEPLPVSRDRYQQSSAPLWKGLADRATRLIDQYTPRWGAPRLSGIAEHAKERLGQVAGFAATTDGMFQLFMPFVHDHRYTFRCDNTRALFARLSPEDQLALPWRPDTIDWRHYWLEVHMDGLERWIFPDLEEEFAQKPRSVYTYRDLLELFDAATKHYKNRTAMRLLPPPGADGEPKRYTYADLTDLASRAAQVLTERGVQPGDRVLLASENRPEWGVTYFGILKAGASAVPIDWQATPEEVARIVESARPRAAVISARVAERLDGRVALPLGLGFDELFAGPRGAVSALAHNARGDDVASVIFTSGTTGRAKGVVLSHKNFSSLLAKLAGVFDIDRHDSLLSVLPLHHTFEFTAGLLMPLMRGAQINYLDEVNADTLEDAFERVPVTGMVGVPALWQAFQRKIEKRIGERGTVALRAFELLVEGSRRLRDRLPPALDILPVLNWGRVLFYPVHRRFGGRLRLLISGGSALSAETFKLFRGLGFNLFEGYGLTEASPVLTVNRPGTRLLPGSVGEPLPGIDVKIADPDERGVGEIIAAGPNVMVGYFENEDATREVLREGWLHTGDLGRLDEDRRLYVVGRKKEMILGANGENVYPDELEELYGDSALVKELSVVGLPEEGLGETVAALVVPDYEAPAAEGLARDEVRRRVVEHVKQAGAKLPAYKRIKVLHLVDKELPKTATRKIKRKEVVAELEKLERLRRKADAAGAAGAGDWLHDLLAEVANRPRDAVSAAARLEELGFDSLMYTELGAALESAGVALPADVDLTSIGTVGELAAEVQRWGRRKAPRPAAPARETRDADEIYVPKVVAELGSAALGWAQRMTYRRLFDTRVTGRAFVPSDRPFLVAANHASHLDMGLCKHAIGDWGDRLVALAAKDYFFEDPIKRAYFENFTNLVPMDRHGSLRESLRLAGEVIEQGYILLIFPEGTRSPTGTMVDFKPSIGYLALHHRIDVLPIYLAGTHGALPKGALLPKQRDIAAHIGPVITCDELKRVTAGRSRAEAYREAARHVELAVRRLAPAGDPNRSAAAPVKHERISASSVMIEEAEGLVGAQLFRREGGE